MQLSLRCEKKNVNKRKIMISKLKLATLSLLYFVQGAPYGFQSACLPIILRSQGLSFTALGVMKLLFIPWVCKPLYAPLIDQTFTRRWWLQTSMLALGVTCLMTSLLSGEAQIMQLSFMMFLLNLFSAVQDIAVDSLAVSILDPHELGAGNTVQVVAYKAGSMFAGGLLLYMREAYGWSPMFLTFASIYFICIALTSQLNLVDADGVRQKQKSDDQNADKEHLSQIFNVKGTLWLVSFVLFYKLCERSEQTFALFLVDKKVPREELALLSTFIRAFSIIGSTASGIALTRGTSAQRLVIQFAVLRAITIFGLTIVLSNWGLEPATFDTTKRDYYFKFAGFSLICLTSISAGAVTTATFTLMMRLSQTAPDKIRGTHYSLLATSEVLGKLMFAALAGWLLDIAGLPIMFVVFTLLAFLVIPFIQSAPPSVINIKSGHQ